MKIHQVINESAASDLAKTLPSLQKHKYDTIDTLIRKISNRHGISTKELYDFFKKKYSAPDSLTRNKLDEDDDLNHNPVMQKFIKWTAGKLHLKTMPKVIFSHDTKDAQDNHHTGSHVQGSNEIWVYAKNRNMVDIMRTIFHEMVHCRQGELGMIKPGDSYPGSPIEVMADMLAGKYIKIFGKEHHEIFQ